MFGIHVLSFRKAALLFLSLLLLNLGGSPAAYVGDPFSLVQSAKDEVQPCVAYNSQEREYLVVWSKQENPGQKEIWGQRVAPDGKLLSGPFNIAWTAGHEKQHPDVVYNVKHNQYLVVFTDIDSTGAISIRGRRVGGKGAQLDAMDLYIQTTDANRGFGHPAVEYAYTSDRYLVAWDAWDKPVLGNYDIYGRIVMPDGSLPSSRFPIAQNGIWPRQKPALAYNRHMNRYMVVWEQYENGPPSFWDIKGQQVTGEGGLWGSVIINLGWSGDNNRSPEIAALPTSGSDIKFMAVWEINPGGSPNGLASAMISETNVIGNMSKVTDGTAVMRSVTVGSNERTKTYLEASWYAGSVGRGWSVYQMTEEGYGIGLLDLIPGNEGASPAIIGGPQGDYLIVWQDRPGGQIHTDIFGQLLGLRQYIPIIVQ